MKKLILLGFLILILFIIAPSALAIFPSYSYNATTKTAIITDNLGISKIAEIELISNSYECLIDCEAILKITPAKDITASKSSDYNFAFLGTDGKDASALLKDFKTEQLFAETYTDNVNDYGTCAGTQIDNKTSKEVPYNYTCVTGTHKEDKTRQVWKPVDFSTLAFKTAEPIYIKITGHKNTLQNIDWQPTFYGQQIKEMQWWNSSWVYKQQLNISSTGNIGAGYQYAKNITYNAHMNADFSDLRFANSTDDGLLNYWIENQSNSNWAYVWINLTTAVNTTNQSIYMYYGNAGATSTSSGNLTFTFFDDFASNSLNATLWTIVNANGAVTFASGVMQINGTGTGTGEVVASWTNWTAPIGLRSLTYAKPLCNYAYLGFYSGLGIGITWIDKNSNAFGTQTATDYYMSGNDVSVLYSNSTGLSTFKNLDILRNSTNAKFYVQANNYTNIASDISGLRNIRLFSRNGCNISFDWILVRAYNDNETLITSTFGAETMGSTLSVTPNAPAEATTFYDTATALFNFTAVSSTSAAFNCSIYLNSTLNTTNTSVSNNTLTNFNISGMSWGSHDWYVNCTDSATSNVSAVWNFTLTNTTPTISLALPANATYNNSIAVNYTATSNGTIDKCWYSLDSGANTSLGGCANTTLTLTSDGSHNIIVYANSTNAITNYSQQYFTVYTKPSITIASPGNTTINNIVLLNYTATTTGTLSACWYNLNGGANNTLAACGNATLNLTDGAYNLTLYANSTTNAIGNASTSFSVSTTPTVTIASPGNSSFATNIMLLNYTATSNGTIDKCWYNLDSNASNTSLAGCANTTFITIDGSHHLIVYANSTTNAVNYSQVWFFTDTTPPNITINSPTNVTYGTNSTWFNITTNEPASECLKSLNGSANDTMSNSSSTFWYNNTILSDGNYTVVYSCNDSVGNWGTNNVSFIINTALPLITVFSPTNTTYGSTTQLFNITVNVNASWCDRNLDGGGNITMGNTSLSDWNETVFGLAESSHSVIFYCNDSLTGNVGYSSPIHFTTDVTSPVVTVSSPANGTAYLVKLDTIANVNMTNPNNAFDYDFATYASANSSFIGYAGVTLGKTFGISRNITGVRIKALYHSDHVAANSKIDLESYNGATWSIIAALVNGSGAGNVSFDSWYNTTINATQGLRMRLWNNGTLSNDYAYLYELQYNSISIASNATDAHLYSCWYSDNGGANASYTCNNIFLGGYGAGWHTVDLWANDTANNIGHNQTAFYINIANESASYNASILENANDTIQLGINATSTANLTGTLYWNGTVYAATASIVNSTYATLTTNISIPLVSADQAINIFWNYTLNGLNSLSINFTQNVMNLQNINISTVGCGALTAAQFYWFANENDTAAIAGVDVAYNFVYGTFNTSISSTYGSLSGIAGFYVCYNSSMGNYTLSYGEVQISKAGVTSRRYYNYVGHNLTTTLENITMYVLPSSTGYPFTFTFTDMALNVYSSDYAKLLRWYPATNQYLQVDGGITDNNGQTVMYVALNDVDYRIGLYYPNGTLIKLADPSRFTCASAPCTYNLRVSSVSSYLTDLNIQHSLTYNTSSSIFSFVWNDPSATTQSMNLIVNKMAGDVDTNVCNSTGAGATGALSCNISAYSSGTFTAVVYRTASPSTPFATLMQTITSTIFKGQMGLFISFIMMVLMIFMALFSPVAAIIMMIASMIFSVMIGAITPMIFISIAFLGVLVIHVMKRIS